MDGNGNAMALWYQRDSADTSLRVYSNRYTMNEGWGAPSPLTLLAGADGTTDIAMDGTGNAVAVWAISDYRTYGHVYAAYYTAGAGWGGASLLSSGADETYSYYPQVVMDGSGNAVAAWEDRVEGCNTCGIYSNHYTAGVGWGAAGSIGSSATRAGSPQLAGDSNGNVVAVWRQLDGTYERIYSNRFIPGAGWGTASLIQSLEGQTPGHAYGQQVVLVGGSGGALAVWLKSERTSEGVLTGEPDSIWWNTCD